MHSRASIGPTVTWACRSSSWRCSAELTADGSVGVKTFDQRRARGSFTSLTFTPNDGREPAHQACSPVARPIGWRARRAREGAESERSGTEVFLGVGEEAPVEERPAAHPHQGLLVRTQAPLHAIGENDEDGLEAAILQLSSRRRFFAPMGMVVRAFAMLFEGLKLLFATWRLTLVQQVPSRQSALAEAMPTGSKCRTWLTCSDFRNVILVVRLEP
jgi:hypothetical protein